MWVFKKIFYEYLKISIRKRYNIINKIFARRVEEIGSSLT